MLHNFLTDEQANFTFKVAPSSQNTNTLHAGFFDENSGLDNVKVKQANGQYVFSVQLRIKNKNIGFNIGSVDFEKNQCLFFDAGKPLTERLINPFFRAALQFFLIKKQGFLLHSCGVVKDGKAYVFSGSGGSGKSTIGEISKELKVLADDFILIRNIKNSYYAYPTPWYEGKGHAGFIIKRLFFLKQDFKTQFKVLSSAQTANELMGNMYYNILDNELLDGLMPVVFGLAKAVPAHILHFSLGDDLWDEINRSETKDKGEICYQQI